MTDPLYEQEKGQEELDNLVLANAARRDYEYEVFKLGFEYGNMYQIPRGDTIPESTMRALFSTVKEVLRKSAIIS